MRLLRYILAAQLGTAAIFGQTYTLPFTQSGNWQPGVYTGVLGGIPTSSEGRTITTSSSLGFDATGATSSSDNIQAWINGASSGHDLLIEAGTYLIDTNFTIPYSKPNIRIYGVGDDTLFVLTGNTTHIKLGPDAGWNYPETALVNTSLATKGATTVTLLTPAQASDFSVGAMFFLGMSNDMSIPIVSVKGAGFNSASGVGAQRRQLNVVTSANPTTGVIGLRYPLYGDYTGSNIIQAHVGALTLRDSGISNLKIDGNAASGQFMIRVTGTIGCWVKNITIVNTRHNHTISVTDSVNVEVRDNRITGAAEDLTPSHSGILFETVAAGLVENNKVMGIFPCIEINHGTSGSYFSFNFFRNSPKAMITNHGSHNNHNLYEFNVSTNFQSDGYHGSASHETFHNNWFHGLNESGADFTTSMKRFTRYHYLLGNILGVTGAGAGGGYDFGTPNISNPTFIGTAQPSLGDWWQQMNASGSTLAGYLLTRTGDNTGTLRLTGTGTLYPGQTIQLDWPGSGGGFYATYISGTDYALTPWNNPPLPIEGTTFTSIWPTAEGFQEKDLDVEATTTKIKNYIVGLGGVGGGIPVDETSALDFPVSFAYTSRPAWLPSEYSWPPFTYADGAALSSADITTVIPAGTSASSGGGGGGGAANATVNQLNVGTLVIP
jgi:hypothetical protein